MLISVVVTAVVALAISGTLGLASTNMTNPAKGALQLWGWIFSTFAGFIGGIVYSTSANASAWWIFAFGAGACAFSYAVIELVTRWRGR